MWNDRFVFVGSALTAVVFWGIIATTKIAKVRWLAWLFTLATVVFVLVVHIAVSWKERSFPDSGTMMLALIGAVVGSFSAKYIATLFDPDFGRRDPLIGGAVLLSLVVIYSLPLYHREIVSLLGYTGVSSLKTPFVELTFNAETGSRGHQGSISASGSSTGSQPQSIPRVSDPTPGLTWLQQDVGDDPNNTLNVDRQYIDFLESGSQDEAFRLYIASVLDQTRSLSQTRRDSIKMSACIYRGHTRLSATFG